MPVVTSTSVYPPGGYPKPKKCPYTENSENMECITALAPKPVDFFPDCVKYPPPKGTKDIINGCGCLMTSWDDAAQGSIRLETIWQPYYDTIDILNTDGRSSFFQNPNGRSEQYTNLYTAGQLSWPKRFHVWEIEFTLEDDDVAAEWQSQLGDGPVVVFRIGEKNHLTVPFSMLHKVPSRTNTYCAPLPSPLYIPSVQNFHVLLEQTKKAYVKVIRIRCALNGYLHREIP